MHGQTFQIDLIATTESKFAALIAVIIPDYTSIIIQMPIAITVTSNGDTSE
jgi:hypothetical protein